MRRFVSSSRVALAFVAAATSVVAPLVAYAHHAAPGRAAYAEVCTDAGIKRLPLAPDDGNPASTERSHCGACIVATGAEAPGPAPASLLRRAGSEPPRPALRFAGTPVERTLASHPRGPPASARSA